MPTTKRRVSVNLPHAEFNRLAALAQQHDVSMAWLGRHAMLEFLERHQRKTHQLPLQLRPPKAVGE